jgi:acetyl esterase/lipase
MAGVDVEIFAPAAGVAPENRDRVLINLHGGGFYMGARMMSHIESIPVAAESGFRVVSVDYRMAPEFRFPAATEDVVAVYRALLEEHSASQIGLFGSSAGALLTAQTVAGLVNASLPVPGALAMLSGAASFWTEGDSGCVASYISDRPSNRFFEDPYFKDVQPEDPTAFPVQSTRILGAFPPSLLVSATRDCALSSVVHTHSRLIELGVPSDLHVWEGVGHAFHYDTELPQSRQVHKIVARFFATHLSS